MKREQTTIIHVNVTNFMASVMALNDPSLRNRAFAITHMAAARRIVIAPSNKAFAEGISVGMPIVTALHRLPSLQLVCPDSLACNQVSTALLTIAQRYTPTVQNDGKGHLYLDITGTSRLFGPPLDCAVRLRNEIQTRLGLHPAIAVAPNKLVAKIGTRTIRPEGIIQVRQGEEAAFLAVQDSSLLSGVGPSISRLLVAAGLHKIGQIAALDDGQVRALLGKRGLALRDAARGLDTSRVDGRELGTRTIDHRIDFDEPAYTLESIRSAIISAVEHVGLQMRKELLVCSALQVVVFWADGSSSEGRKTTTQPLVLDHELITVAWQATHQAMQRRIRIRACTVTLHKLSPASRELDLFTPPREELLQATIDAVRIRFGPASLTHAAAIFHV